MLVLLVATLWGLQLAAGKTVEPPQPGTNGPETTTPWAADPWQPQEPTVTAQPCSLPEKDSPPPQR